MGKRDGEMTKSRGTKSQGRKCGRKMNWQKYGFPVWSALRTDQLSPSAGNAPSPPLLAFRVGFLGLRPVVAARHRGVPWSDRGSVPVARRNIGGGVESKEAAVMGEQPRRREQSGTPVSTAGFTIHGLHRSYSLLSVGRGVFSVHRVSVPGERTLWWLADGLQYVRPSAFWA